MRFAAFALAAALTAQPALTPDVQAALNRISPDSLRGNLSFLASDLLEGRDTPSKGLDIAAEFIAAQFRKAGLEPGGDQEFFQTAKLVLQQQDMTGFELALNDAQIAADQVSVQVSHEVDVAHAPIFKMDLSDSAGIDKLTPEQLDGKVVIVEFSRGAMQSGRKAFSKIRGANPAAVITISRGSSEEREARTEQLYDPESEGRQQPPRLTVSGKSAADFYDALQPGLSQTAFAKIHIAAPKRRPVELHNVVGILRGSDPALKDTCVMVSAHYDHIGEKTSGEGDRIYNGANDDGSGTVSVIELANALAGMKVRPKRSIVFVTFFGEEKGLFGSRYYAHHPAFPLAKTVADLNLEQVGRTDSTEGPQIANATVTGYDYSTVTNTLETAGKLTGIKIYKNAQNSDMYFSASDNVNLAEGGVPAHSICVAFNYPDYHGLGDEWQKIDYKNMAKVDRMTALALVMIADNRTEPHWNAQNPKTQAYFKAWKADHSR